MYCKSEYEDMCSRLGLDDTERTLAALAWNKCEKTMLGKSSQVPKLFDNTEYNGGSAHDLTTSEKQWLISLFADLSRIGTINEYALRCRIQDLWVHCDPEDKDTETIFKDMNALKTMRRKFKKQRATLNQIQRKLKKSR